MKKWCVLVAALLCLLLCGCGKAPGSASVTESATRVSAAESGTTEGKALETHDSTEEYAAASVTESGAAAPDASKTVGLSGDEGAGDVQDTQLRLSQTQAVKRDKFDKEAAFAEFLLHYEKAFRIPGLTEGAIPQGMDYCEGNGRFYISSYYSTELPSVITAVDAGTGELCAEYFLYETDGSAFASHVGGLACVGDTLYVSAKLDNDGKYAVGVLPIGALPDSGSHTVTVEKQIEVPVSPSFMNCSGGYLWCGNFYYPKADYNLPDSIQPIEGYGCLILGYPEEKGIAEDDAVPTVVLAAPDRIQGFVMTEPGHVLLSQSYGRKNNSSLLAYEVDFSGEPDTLLQINGTEVPVYILRESLQTESTTAMPMTEALCLNGQGNVMVLFESGAIKYSDGLFRTDCVWMANTAE